MDTVVEIYVLRKVVNAIPLDRLVIAEARSDGLQVRGIGPKLAVTVHTRLGRWHAGRSRRLNRLMTIAAINAVVANVVLMRELHGLLYLEILPCQVRRSGKLCPGVKAHARQQHDSHHADLRNVIGALSKDLCHLKTRSSSIGGVNFRPDQVEFFASNELSRNLLCN